MSAVRLTTALYATDETKMQNQHGILLASQYPLRLKELDNPPKELFYKGVCPTWTCSLSETHPKPVVAIVGARRASNCATELSFRIAKRLGEAGATVLSGGALGIDAAAHQGALAGGGNTGVVLPSSLCRPLPRTNVRLFEEILTAGGFWISEYKRPPAGRYAFCARNRIIAALSDFVLVIEAGTKSGTTYTVDAAIRLGRPVGAVPWQVTEERGQVAMKIFTKGGYPIGDAREVYRRLNLDLPRPDFESLGKPKEMSDELRAAIEGHGAASLQTLAEVLGCPITEMGRHLVELELSGLVKRGNSGMYRLCDGI